MKTSKLILLFCLIMLTSSSAQALEPMRFINGFFEATKFTSFEVKNRNHTNHHRRWKKHHPKRWKKHQQKMHNKSKSVPELDSSNAPLAGILLACLLAAGAERRRKYNNL